MTTEGWIPREEPSGGEADWHTARELLKARQYERIAQLLEQAQLTNEQTHHALLVDIIAVARHICEALTACQDEKKTHQQAYEEASEREQKLEHQLQAMFDLISSREAPDAPEQVAASVSSGVELNLPKPDAPISGKRGSLWQRVKNMLGQRATTLSPRSQETAASGEVPLTSYEQKTVEVSALPLIEKDDVLTPSPVEETGSPAVPPTQKSKVPTPPSAEKVEGPASLPAEEAKGLVTSPAVGDEKPEEQGPPSFMIYCLGLFRVYQDDQPVEGWLSSKGLSVFKYLVTHRERPVAKEVLMDLFWPDATADAARNNLNVAIYGLRRTLRQVRPKFSHVLFQDEYYLLNPELQPWVDVEEFMERLRTARNLEQRGELASAVGEYGAAEALYLGEFLAEDRYEEWLLPQRQRLQEAYLNLLDQLSRYYFDQENYDACATRCDKMLAVDPCREEAHRRLMRCYSQQGQRYLSLRQYHICVEALAQELDVGPSQTTMDLYEQIHRTQ